MRTPHGIIKTERERPDMGSQTMSMHSGPTVPASEWQRSMAPPPMTAPSLTQSFRRSNAPSLTTYVTQQPRDTSSDTTYDTPQLLEMRTRQDLQPGGLGRSTPSSQGDGNFNQASFAHMSFTGIGLKLKACNDTLGELQQLGVQHVAQLPELVMVGDQSAGKSSLMSGLAEIDLPRSAGVCTRCPIHIRLSRSNDHHWSCSVSLQQDYDYQPPNRKIKKSDVTRGNPFPPWIKSHRVVKNFKTIYDRSEIEDVLRWAQVAILNHSTPSDLFIPGEGAYAKDTSLEQAIHETEAQFSPNIVALEIKGPNLPDLSFYDLPGVFLAPSNEDDEYIVQVVKNLTTEYVRREQAIIMWALPMNHDPENSISLGIIRDAKAQSRTIGVITKADKIQPDSTAQWVSMLRGEKHPVGHGFFITSRPPLDKNEPLERGNLFEEQFFSTNSETWPSEFQEFSSRCGVEILKEFLSSRLGDAFSSSLPSIRDKVHERLHYVRDELSRLPELPHNVEHEVRKSLLEFYKNVKLAIADTEFQSEWEKLNKQFQACILGMKPTCYLRTTEPTTFRNTADNPLDLTGDDDDGPGPDETPSRKRPRPSDSTVRSGPKRPRAGTEAGPSTPIKAEGDGIPPTPSLRSTPAPQGLINTPFQRYLGLGRQSLNIPIIRAEINRRKRAGLPTIIPEGVYDHLVIREIKKWEEPLQTYTDLTMKMFKQALHNALQESMESLRRRTIFVESEHHLDSYINEMTTRQYNRLKDIYEDEQNRMYTTNEDAFKMYRESEEDILKRSRAICRLQAAGELPLDYKVRLPNNMKSEELAEERKSLTQKLKKLEPDPHNTEINVAAVVRGYYTLAATRFVENITLSINSRLFKEVGGCSLDMFLDQELGLYRANEYTFTRLMEEDETTAQRRENLKREMEKLLKAISSIENLGFGGGGGLLGGFSGGGSPRDVPGDLESTYDEA
ncbi:P-loop containing nucleoside triphosphate hydrolase protein [Xylariales sp. PMI_506]|nr:P-loop containing nucleoside triphosphate hydrolase protein [Xylariales sp. PMI_506]